MERSIDHRKAGRPQVAWAYSIVGLASLIGFFPGWHASFDRPNVIAWLVTTASMLSIVWLLVIARRLDRAGHRTDALLVLGVAMPAFSFAHSFLLDHASADWQWWRSRMSFVLLMGCALAVTGVLGHFSRRSTHGLTAAGDGSDR